MSLTKFLVGALVGLATFTFGKAPAQASPIPQSAPQSRDVGPGHVQRNVKATREQAQRQAILDELIDDLVRAGAPRKKIRWLKLEIDKRRYPQFFEGASA